MIAGGILCALVLIYALFAFRECADKSRLKLFYESIRIDMPRKEANAFVNAYVIWLDPNLAEEDFIYEDDSGGRNTWHFYQYPQGHAGIQGMYWEILEMEIRMENDVVVGKSYKRKKCVHTPAWAKTHIDIGRCF